MDYSAVPNRDAAEESHSNDGKKKRYKCCCCRLTKMQIVLTVCLVILGPIVALGATFGIIILVHRLSYNPPPSQFSNANDTMAFLNEIAAEMVLVHNATDVNIMRKDSTGFQTEASPPWTDCGSSMAIPRVVRMEKCELEDSRCLFDLDTDWMVEIAFTMKPDADTVAAPKFEMCGRGVLRPTPCRAQQTKYPNPCEESNLECPLQPGKNYLYRNVVAFTLKGLPFKLTWKAYVDLFFKFTVPDSTKTFLCVRVPTMFNPDES